MEIPIRRSKDDLVSDILREFREYERYKREKIDRYTKYQQLGLAGKEGITLLVKTPEGKEYAMKMFKKGKSSEKLTREVNLQKLAADVDVAPRIIDVDTISKFIVMDKLDTHLYDLIKKQGTMTLAQQKQVIHIYKKLDKAGVFHGDANLLNYMYKGTRLYIIDFGNAKEITTGLIKKLGTNRPNVEIMTLGMACKLKDLGFPPDSYEYLLSHIPNDKVITFFK